MTIKKEKLTNLKKIRKDILGKTQSEMANAIGCKRSSYTCKENGERDFSMEEMRVLKNYINNELAFLQRPTVSMEEIFFKGSC